MSPLEEVPAFGFFWVRWYLISMLLQRLGNRSNKGSIDHSSSCILVPAWHPRSAQPFPSPPSPCTARTNCGWVPPPRPGTRLPWRVRMDSTSLSLYCTRSEGQNSSASGGGPECPLPTAHCHCLEFAPRLAIGLQP